MATKASGIPLLGGIHLDGDGRTTCVTASAVSAVLMALHYFVVASTLQAIGWPGSPVLLIYISEDLTFYLHHHAAHVPDSWINSIRLPSADVPCSTSQDEWLHAQAWSRALCGAFDIEQLRRRLRNRRLPRNLRGSNLGHVRSGLRARCSDSLDGDADSVRISQPTPSKREVQSRARMCFLGPRLWHLGQLDAPARLSRRLLAFCSRFLPLYGRYLFPPQYETRW